MYFVLPRSQKKLKLVKGKKNKSFAFKGDIKSKFFCSKFSNEYKVYKKIQNAKFEFEKESQFDIYKNALDKSGVDFKIPIFKIEAYNKTNFENTIMQLKTFKNLQIKGVRFNLFIFVDNYEKLKKAEKILRVFNLKDCVARVYHCLEIDYKLLGAINFFSLNNEEIIRPLTKKQLQKLNNETNQNICLDKDSFAKLNNYLGLFIQEGGETYKLENFCYKNYFETQTFSSDLFSFEVKRSFDYERNFQIYNLVIHNKSENYLSFKICFGNVFEFLSTKNLVYVNECKDGKYALSLKTINKEMLFCGQGFNCKTDKNFMGVVRNIKIEAGQKLDFCFANFFSLDSFKNFEVKILNQDLLTNVISKYSNINLPKVFSSNKNINELINNYLPQKILKKAITSANVNDCDFIMLKNNIFGANLINKDILSSKLGSIYLLKQNLFSVYQNLLYFYFGIYPTNLGVNINSDKSLILNESVTSFVLNGKKVVVRFKDLGLKNEVKINNIRYSNLKFLTLSNFKQEMIDVFY